MISQSKSFFETRFNEWTHIHPLYDYFGRDPIQNINEHFDRIVESQYTSADKIIASQEEIIYSVNEIKQGLERVNEGLDAIEATLEWGFTELIWQMEQTNVKLQKIIELLQKPLDTQAIELKKRGEEAYSNGWFDDSLNDFLESEQKNKYDFTIHHYIGNIYFFHNKNPIKAIAYYKKAIKYAIPKSPRHASFSLIHIGKIYELQDDFKAAYESTLKALELNPNFPNAHYQHARYCTKLKKYNESIKHLKIAIVDGNRFYCIKADTDKIFKEMKKQLKILFKELRDETNSKVKNEINEIKKLIQEEESYGIDRESIIESKMKLEKVVTLLKKNSYFGNINCILKSKESKRFILDLLINRIHSMISHLEKRIIDLEKKTQPSDSHTNSTAWWILAILALIPTYFFGRWVLSILGLDPVTGFGIIFFYVLMLLIFPAFWKWMTFRHYLPLIKTEKEKLKSFENNVSNFIQQFEDLVRDAERKKSYQITNSFYSEMDYNPFNKKKSDLFY